MTVLLTGGTGKTSQCIARLLQNAGIPFVLAARRAAPVGMPAVKFDWLDPSTFENPFRHTLSQEEPISAVYVVPPAVADSHDSMTSFIDYAVGERGVTRVVVLSGVSAQPGSPGTGKLWQHLLDMGIDYTILRPTWFMENLSDPETRTVAPQKVIKDQGRIYSACADGKIPYISATDIAAVAFHALTDKNPHNCDYRLVGPELLTCDQLASKLSSVIGRRIEHVRLSEDERLQMLMSEGVAEQRAKFLASRELWAAAGNDAVLNDIVQRVTGRPPKTFDTFAQENVAAWQ